MNSQYLRSLHWDLSLPEKPNEAQLVKQLWFRGNQLLVDGMGQPIQLDLDVAQSIFVASIGDQQWYARCLSEEVDVPNEATVGLRALAGQDTGLFALASRAYQLLRWRDSHKFCGSCGSKTKEGQLELVMECTVCSMLFYPKISPCVIVLIHRGRDVLLAHNINNKESNMRSLIAGFVEVGETIEQAVHREVMEEVGISVKELTYQGSQSWPFPSQLMLGFYATFDAGEIRIQKNELLEAKWYSIDQLPEIPPLLSIAGWMIKNFVEACLEGEQ